MNKIVESISYIIVFTIAFSSCTTSYLYLKPSNSIDHIKADNTISENTIAGKYSNNLSFSKNPSDYLWSALTGRSSEVDDVVCISFNNGNIIFELIRENIIVDTYKSRYALRENILVLESISEWFQDNPLVWGNRNQYRFILQNENWLNLYIEYSGTVVFIVLPLGGGPGGINRAYLKIGT